MTEIDALDPVPEQVKLSSGTVVMLEPLKARQFFKFLRIITHGALPVMQDLSIFNIDGEIDPREFGQRLLTVMVLSIPDAENETIDFLQAMCKPYGLIEGRKLNKVDTERNAELWNRLAEELENPELDDLVTLVEAIIRRESEDIQALGKRLSAMFKLAEKTGQVPQRLTSQEPNSSAASPVSSTYSVPSTGGTTTTSGASVSVAYDSVSQPFENDGSTNSGSESNG